MAPRPHSPSSRSPSVIGLALRPAMPPAKLELINAPVVRLGVLDPHVVADERLHAARFISGAAVENIGIRP